MIKFIIGVYLCFYFGLFGATLFILDVKDCKKLHNDLNHKVVTSPIGWPLADGCLVKLVWGKDE